MRSPAGRSGMPYCSRIPSWPLPLVLTERQFLPAAKTGRRGSGTQATGQPIGKPMVHQEAVVGLAFSPDGKILLTGSADKTARLWNVTTTDPIGRPMEYQGDSHAL